MNSSLSPQHRHLDRRRPDKSHPHLAGLTGTTTRETMHVRSIFPCVGIAVIVTILVYCWEANHTSTTLMMPLPTLTQGQYNSVGEYTDQLAKTVQTGKSSRKGGYAEMESTTFQSATRAVQPERSSPGVSHTERSLPEVSQPEKSSLGVRQPERSSPGVSQPERSSPEVSHTEKQNRTRHFPAGGVQTDKPSLKGSDIERKNMTVQSQAINISIELQTMPRDAAVVVIGTVISGAKYAVFSCTTTNEESLNYLFPLPLTALAWRRLGYGSLVLLVGDYTAWRSNPLKQYVASQLRELDAILVFINAPQHNEVMVSQVSRIFATNFIPPSHFSNNSTEAMERTYFVTSDSDLWPIKADVYEIPTEKLILSLNSACCGSFVHSDGQTYTMRPMANVAMTLSTWQQVTWRNGTKPRTAPDIVSYISREFGSEVAKSSVRKGMNLGWFLDQRLLSVLLTDWARREAGRNDLIQFVPRRAGRDRIDRSRWDPATLAGMTDSHILNRAYILTTWDRLKPLIRLLYNDTPDYHFAIAYHEHFHRLLTSNSTTSHL